MASSSVGSDLFTVAALLVICLAVLLLLRHYLPLRTTPAFLLVPVFLALALPASIILLVPIDVASASEDDRPKGIWLPERVLLVAWRICYWLIFILTWVILPLLGEYVDSGYRAPKDRFLYALRSNGRYQLMVLTAGGLGATYFFLQSGFNFESLKGLVMALAYAWGLILAIYLMGHGLVAMPRKLFRYANVSERLRRLQTDAPKVHERMTEAIEELDEYEEQALQLRQRKAGIARDFQDWIEELAEPAGLSEPPASRLPTFRESRTSVPSVITERYLADLTRKLKRARHKKARFSAEWALLVQDAVDTQTILDSAASKQLDFGRASPNTPFFTRLKFLTPYTRYLFHMHIIPVFSIALGGLLSIASLALIWSEIVKFFLDKVPKLSFVSLTVVYGKRVNFGGQLFAAVWLTYMCAAALTSMAEVKIWGNRALVRRQTYPESACWYAAQVAKLTVPLAYNFITMLDPDVYKDTVYFHFLGSLINLTPIGSGFSSFFPIFILVPVLATLFGLYGRIKRVCGCFGFGNPMDDEEDEEGNLAGYGTGGWREGRTLIEREVSGAAGPGTGSSSHTLGLNARRGLMDDVDDHDSDVEAGRSRPAARRTVGQGQRYRDAPARRTGLLDPQPDEAGEEEGGFFQDLAHRVQNTIDTTERPAWLEGLKRPKWMGGQDEGGGRSDASGLGRWFGGRSEPGRLRL